MTSGLFEECLDAVSVIAKWNEVVGIVASQSTKRLANLLGKVRHCCYLAQRWLLENLGMQQEKQLSSAGTKFNTALSGTHYQAINMTDTLLVYLS